MIAAGRVGWVPVVLALVAGAAPARAKDDPGARYEAIREDYLALRGDSERRRFRHNYLRILDAFEGFVEDHPDHAKAPDALYNAGRLAWDLYLVSRVHADLDRARTLYERLADRYPEDNLADDALFLVGRILLEHGGDKTDAYRAFAGVVRRFPSGDMAGQAQEMLSRLAAYRPADPAPEKAPETRVVARATSWAGEGTKGTAQAASVKTWSNDDFTRVAIYLSGPVSWREGEVPADPDKGLPRRIYVDLKPAVLTAEAAAPVAVGDGLLQQVRTGQFSPDTVRVVLDLATVRHAKVFPMEGPDRLVIDVTGENAPPDVARAAPAEDAGQKTPAVAEADLPNLERVRAKLSKKQEIPLSVQVGLKIRRVVVDAGHGGHDNGAVGRRGTKEKDIALSIAKKLGAKLAKAGLEVIYTRTDDTFVPLEERTAIANTRGADLFISVHCNANVKRDRRGVSTYYLDVSNDRYGIRLAAQENATTEKSVSDLQFILADLAKRSNTDDSIRLATRIQERTVGRLSKGWHHVRDLGVKYALFYVLLGAKMPSVLVETSFISNPTEEHRLRSTVYQDAVAEGIFQGVKAFIDDRNAVALGRK